MGYNCMLCAFASTKNQNWMSPAPQCAPCTVTVTERAEYAHHGSRAIVVLRAVDVHCAAESLESNRCCR